jgi:hypothetical protein
LAADLTGVIPSRAATRFRRLAPILFLCKRVFSLFSDRDTPGTFVPIPAYFNNRRAALVSKQNVKKEAVSC